MSDWGARLGQGLKPLSSCLGDSSCCCGCLLLGLPLLQICAACVDHDDDNNSGLRVKHMTRGSCADWQNIAVCVRCARVAATDVPAALVVITI